MHIMHVMYILDHLSKEELMKHKNAVDPILIRRLQEAGCPMPENCEGDPMPGLVAVVSRPEITRAYVMRGWAEYVVALRITNHSYDRLEVKKFECNSYWPTRLIGQPGPRICGPGKPAYRLPGSGRTFPYESVLNHRTGGRINPGDSMEGILLASRRQPYPEECLVVDLVIPVELSIVDQYGSEHVSEIKVTVDRTAIINSLIPSRSQGRGLFDQARVAVREQARRSGSAEISSDIPDKRATPKLVAKQGVLNRGFEHQTENLRP
jgi:hypothetical protein